MVKRSKFVETLSFTPMPDLSKKQASILALLFFALTIILSLVSPKQIIILSGLQIVVFLSIFARGKGSTLIAGIISAIIVLLHSIRNDWSTFTTDNWIRYGFV